MKKILMTIVAVFAAMNMSAQLYLGGSFAFQAWESQKLVGDKSETVFKLLPEIGYNLNDEWAIGTVIGYQSNKFSGIEYDRFGAPSESAFTFNPYVRYTFAKLGKVNLFVDGGVDFTTASDYDWNSVGIGLKPGLAVNLTDKLSFVSHVGFLGWEQFNPDGDDNNISEFGIDLSGANLTFGLYFSF